MMRKWADYYPWADAAFPGEYGQWDVWVSPAVQDLQWDEFVRAAPGGQFQQSSIWAEYKAGEGWKHHRVIVTDTTGLVGGFQLLWKKRGPIRLGYVSKGPVWGRDSADSKELLEQLLLRTAKDLGLAAVIVQEPDESLGDTVSASPPGFVLSNPMGIIESTCLVDVSPEVEKIRGRMSPSLRKNIRKAKKQGLTVREGGFTDLPRFFELMAATCLRQKAQPNPPTVEALQLLWKAFSPSQSIRITFAESQDGALAAQLCIIFGDRVTLWKKGWDGAQGQWHPNELLEDEVLEWAHHQGHRLGDFCSLSRFTAERIIRGQPLGRKGLTPRDAFTLRFGGVPLLLPRSRVLIPNPALRWGYSQTIVRLEELRNRFRRLMGGI